MNQTEKPAILVATEKQRDCIIELIDLVHGLKAHPVIIGLYEGVSDLTEDDKSILVRLMSLSRNVEQAIPEDVVIGLL
jgi:hypothetical protein